MKTSIAVFLASLALSAQAFAFEVKLTDIKPGSKISEDHVFNSFGCSGKNISPEIHWSKAPKDTKYFAVTMFDPDAPTGSGWWHWLVFNIPANVDHLAADAGNPEKPSLPEGAVQSRTDFGKPGYGGPCPPPGPVHHYVFTVFALKDKLPLETDSPAAMGGFYANQNKLATAKVTAVYGRKK